GRELTRRQPARLVRCALQGLVREFDRFGESRLVFGESLEIALDRGQLLRDRGPEVALESLQLRRLAKPYGGTVDRLLNSAGLYRLGDAEHIAQEISAVRLQAVEPLQILSHLVLRSDRNVPGRRTDRP